MNAVSSLATIGVVVGGLLQQPEMQTSIVDFGKPLACAHMTGDKPEVTFENISTTFVHEDKNPMSRLGPNYPSMSVKATSSLTT